MSIRLDHTHKDHACYRISGRHPLSQRRIFRVGGREFAIAYMLYTGSYYVYDTETGDEIARIGRQFIGAFDTLLGQAFVRAQELQPDTEGLCTGIGA